MSPHARLTAAALLLTVAVCCCYGQADYDSLPCSAQPTTISGQSFGRISILRQTGGGSGYRKYPNSTICAWLVIGGKNSSVVVEFEYMNTECGADFVYVVDGLSLSAPGSRVLGGFSGSTLPDFLTATSGFVAVYFTSDVSHTAFGFSLNFTIFGAPAPDQLHAPSNTSSPSTMAGAAGDGRVRVCGQDLPGAASAAAAGATAAEARGWSCDFNLSSSAAAGQWLALSSSAAAAPSWSLPTVGPESHMSRRASHVAVWCPLAQALFVFGGCDASGDVLYDDVWAYDLAAASWDRLGAGASGNGSGATPLWPAARRGHAAAYIGGGRAFVYGGRLLGSAAAGSGGLSSAELWLFSTTSRRWTELPAGPRASSGHTLTAVDDRWLYLIGGTLDDGSVSGRVYRFDTAAAAAGSSVVGGGPWEEVTLTGSGWPDLAVTGHTTVYDPATRSLLTFGGHRPLSAQYVGADSVLYVLQVDGRYLSRLDTSASGSAPEARAYHSATVIGPYMAVYGGTTISDDSNCMDPGLHLYHMGCHSWVDPAALPGGSAGSYESSFRSVIRNKGRSMHAAALAYGNVLLIVGGYRGNTLDDVVAYVAPPAVARFQAPNGGNSSAPSPPDSAATICASYGDRATCNLDLQCSWSQRSAAVLPSCSPVAAVSVTCPGVCGFLTTCASCTLNGNPWPESAPSALLRPGEGCVWCVASQTCVSSAAYGRNSAVCSVVSGWWPSGSAPVVRNTSACRLDDRPPGAYMSVLLSPPDPTRPDKVIFFQTTVFQTPAMQIDPAADCDSSCVGFSSSCVGCYTTVEATGYIHPPVSAAAQRWPVSYHLRVFKSTGFLYAFCSAAQARLLDSFNVTPSTQADSSSPLLPSQACTGSLQQSWRFRLGGAHLSVDPAAVFWSISLLWNGSSDGYYEYTELQYGLLEAYASDNCSAHSNCLACVSDMNCGWCPLTDACLDRAATAAGGGGSSACGGASPATWLATEPGRCVLCEQFFDCGSCTSSRYCEWLPRKLLCIRRGRSASSIGDPARCPPACRARSNCSDCLTPSDQCIWCSDVVGCISQLELQTTYLYGQCRTWIENFVNNGSAADKCRHCSSSVGTCAACLSSNPGSIPSSGGSASRRGRFCGWCYDAGNPTSGLCAAGDYGGPLPDTSSGATSAASQSCLALLSAVSGLVNSSAAVAAAGRPLAGGWAFDECPHVDECRLRLDNCSQNATCTDKPTAFACSCDRGFDGDGYTCSRTCYPACVHGACGGSPDYVCRCDLGWFGGDCSHDCGCNNLSSCSSGPGKCDACQLGSVGASCEACPDRMHRLDWPSAGCAPCLCNGHGDGELNLCSNLTGVCYCLHNTVGNHCDTCADGYFGDPRNGGWCYPGYDGRTVLTNLRGSGTFGTVLSRNLFVLAGAGKGGSIYDYTWVLTVFPDMATALALPKNASSSIVLEVTDIQTDCNLDHVYVYDNATSFVHMLTSPSDDFASSTYLASVCGDGRQAMQRIVSRTGFLGIYYRQPLAALSGSVWRRLYARYTVLPVPSAETAGPPALSLAQSAVTCDGGETVYIVGALPAAVAAADEPSLTYFLWRYNVSESLWRPLGGHGNQTGTRYYHIAAACIGGRIYMHGGLRSSSYPGGGASSNESATAAAAHDMLAYDVSTGKWHSVAAPGAPAVAGHSMTAISGSRLLIVGGYNPGASWNPDVYVLTPSSSADSALPIGMTVARQQTLGSVPFSIAFHTAVFHSASGNLYVHGGFQYNAYSLSRNYFSGLVGVSSSVYVLRTSSWRWDLLPPAPSTADGAGSGPQLLPFSRYLHTAIDVHGRYMLVLGGMSSSTTYVPNATLYDYECNTWTLFNSSDNDSIVPAIRQGAVVHRGNSIAIITTADQPAITGCLPSVCSLNATSGPQSTRDRQCVAPAYPPCSDRPSCPLCQQLMNIMDAIPDCTWNDRCSSANSATSAAEVLLSPCTNEKCRFGSCFACINDCSWTTSNIELLNDTHAVINDKGGFGGSCIANNLLRRMAHVSNMTVYQPVDGGQDASGDRSACPPTCSDYYNAFSCLAASGVGEGGPPLGCVWSFASRTCMSPARSLLLCSRGECGSVATNNTTAIADVACGTFNRSCMACLNRPTATGFGKCVWVTVKLAPSVKLPLDNSTGGSSSSRGYCAAVTPDIAIRQDVKLWHLQCPPQKPCADASLNVCDVVTEKCIDIGADSYTCDCAAGYVLQKPGGAYYAASCVVPKSWHWLYGVCVPTCGGGVPAPGGSGGGCTPGRGCCRAPNVCECKFGYVGTNCSVECECNGHSQCAPKAPSLCLNCTHFTKGTSCNSCMPHYVGNPANGGQCWACLSLCNNLSNVCSLPMTTASPLLPQADLPGNVTCSNCQSNTDGPTCSTCKPGYFRLLSYGPCMRCRCNGHGTDCSGSTGECTCTNNTISPKPTPLSWQNQCSACAGGYEGRPTDSRQCYATTIADTGTVYSSYCLSSQGLTPCDDDSGVKSLASDSSSISDSAFASSLGSGKGTAKQLLQQGSAIFFEVAPRFFNIDVRVVMDITIGSVDALFTTNYSTFAVKYNATTNEHVVYLDGRLEPFLAAAAAEATTSVPQARHRRQAAGASAPSAASTSGATSNLYSSSSVTGIVGDSGSTYFDLSDAQPVVSLPLALSSDYPNSYTVVRGLSRRLVLTLNHDRYDFRYMKVFVIVIARGPGRATAGRVTLRQDQVEINLFVFFAVFFAFVFKAMSIAAIALKMRQLRAIQRRQMQRQGELVQMASRPFASVIAHVVDADGLSGEREEEAATEADCEQPLLSGLGPPGSRRGGGSIDAAGQQRQQQTHPRQAAAGPASSISVRPLAVEPLAGGSCAVATVLVRLPGNSSAPVLGCLGSVLVAVKGPVAVASAALPAAQQQAKLAKSGAGEPARLANRQQQQQGRGRSSVPARSAAAPASLATAAVATGRAGGQAGAASQGGNHSRQPQQQPRGQGQVRGQAGSGRRVQQRPLQPLQPLPPTQYGGGSPRPPAAAASVARRSRLPPGVAESSA